MTIIASVLGILLFIVYETLPLAFSAQFRLNREIALPSDAGTAGAAVSDEYKTRAAVLGIDGVLRVVDLTGGRVLSAEPVIPAQAGPLTQVRVAPASNLLYGATRDGRLVLEDLRFQSNFSGAERSISVTVAAHELVEMDPQRRPLALCSVRRGDDGRLTAVAQLADGSLAVLRRTVETNSMTGETSAAESRETLDAPTGLTVLALDGDQRRLYGGTARGEILRWTLAEGTSAPDIVPAGASPITALALLLGERALVAGQANGAVSVWFAARQPDGTSPLTRVREFPRFASPVTLLAVSPRVHGFLAQDRAGTLMLAQSTSERVMWSGRSPLEAATALGFAPKGDGGLLVAPGRLVAFDLDAQHPEISWKALFGKIWYEGYPAPDHVVQTSSGSEDFEPKFSLVPLVFGTLKGTLYSLLIAIPLAVFSAMYASQFVSPALRRVIKPAVELMAALPSVVLGFLAGLWLAPRIDRYFVAILAMAVVLPLSALLAGATYERLPASWRTRWAVGSEVFLAMGFLLAGGAVALWISTPLSLWLFDGSFQHWLLTSTGAVYDQRNAVVVGFAMGFAVIPVIFSVSDEAFSNVPRTLVAGSLALGATRWQTVTRVVLPSASPGIFSAIMIGFGRAVGETMIVLMATGNTPILDWSPFNGFRTLSAHIATEIPEAPFGGTLYRTLFLAALLLFGLTFAVNTVAELVRQKLRRRYASL